MAKVIDKFINPQTGMLHFSVEDQHGVRSEHTIVMDAAVDHNAHMAQILAERDARAANIEAWAKRLGLEIRVGQ